MSHFDIWFLVAQMKFLFYAPFLPYGSGDFCHPLFVSNMLDLYCLIDRIYET
jgi:hypothetical protein